MDEATHFRFNCQGVRIGDEVEICLGRANHSGVIWDNGPQQTCAPHDTTNLDVYLKGVVYTYDKRGILVYLIREIVPYIGYERPQCEVETRNLWIADYIRHPNYISLAKTNRNWFHGTWIRLREALLAGPVLVTCGCSTVFWTRFNVSRVCRLVGKYKFAMTYRGLPRHIGDFRVIDKDHSRRFTDADIAKEWNGRIPCRAAYHFFQGSGAVKKCLKGVFTFGDLRVLPQCIHRELWQWLFGAVKQCFDAGENILICDTELGHRVYNF